MRDASDSTTEVVAAIVVICGCMSRPCNQQGYAGDRHGKKLRYCLNNGAVFVNEHPKSADLMGKWNNSVEFRIHGLASSRANLPPESNVIGNARVLMMPPANSSLDVLTAFSNLMKIRCISGAIRKSRDITCQPARSQWKIASRTQCECLIQEQPTRKAPWYLKSLCQQSDYPI